MTLVPGQTLSHYRLLEKIGEGGMGVVWKARDSLLGRVVAIKLLPEHAERVDGRRRLFLREARLASSLNDPHIAQVYELGREGEVEFIVMEWVDGRPLSQELAQRSLETDEVLSIALQVASAVAQAHRNGLLHRDLKPGNILLRPDGQVKVVDFGLATLLHSSGPTALSELPTLVHDATVEGKVAGTLPYMSPEQARAEPLDTRSDIFSLGSVLYEMATRERPFAGRTAAEMIEQIAAASPRPPRDLNPKIPLKLERIILKSLARTRSQRYASMEELIADLNQARTSTGPLSRRVRPTRPLLWTVVAAASLLTVAGVWYFRPAHTVALDAQKILIPPMEVHGQTEGADYVGYALAEALAVGLAESPDLKIVPPSFAPQFDPRDRTAVMRLAREQGAARFLTGRAIRGAGTLRITMSLIDVGAGRILWGLQESGPENDLPSISDACVKALRARLGIKPPDTYEYFRYVSGSARMKDWPLLPETLAALRGHDIQGGLSLTATLIHEFPDEHEAHVMRLVALNDANDAADQSPATRRDLEEGLRAIERVDPNSPHPQINRALLKKVDGRKTESAHMLGQVLDRQDLSPALRAQVLRYLAQTETETRAAMDDLERARKLDPASPFTYYFMSVILMKEGRTEDAMARARQAKALAPMFEFPAQPPADTF